MRLKMPSHLALKSKNRHYCYSGIPNSFEICIVMRQFLWCFMIAEMINLKEQRVFIKSSFKLDKAAMKTL